MSKRREIDRLTMAEVVLDAVLTVLVDKKVLTRDEIQQQIIKQAQADTAKSTPS